MWLAFSACGHHSPVLPDDTSDDTKAKPAATNPLARYQAAFALSWNGSRIGYASERVRDNRLHRREEITVRRGDSLVQLITLIDIAMDDTWRATSVKVERRVGATVTRGHASRDGSRWRVVFGDEPSRWVNGDAIPLELLPLVLARKRQRKFAGEVLLSGYGFAQASINVAPMGRRRLMTTLTTAAGKARTFIDLTDEGTIARVRGEVGAAKIPRRELGAPFRPPEMVDNSSLRVAGVAPRFGQVRIAMRNAPRRTPPQLPGQRVVATPGGTWRITMLRGDRNGQLSSKPASHLRPDPGMAKLAHKIIRNARARSTRDKLIALTRATRTMLLDDMATPVHEARAALALGRGDCTSHAALLSSMAGAVGITTRLVTGFRLDNGRMIRHRWVIGHIGGAWMAVDPTYGEAPARPRLLGLAVHDRSAAQLAIVDDMAFSRLRDVSVTITH